MSAGSSTRPLPPEPADAATDPRPAAGPAQSSAMPPPHTRLTRLTRAVRPAPPPVVGRFPWLAAPAAVAAGALLLLAFPPHDLWPLAPLGAGLLALAVRGAGPRRAAWLGLACGLALFVPLLRWSGTYVGPAPWLLLALSQAAFFAPLGAALAAVQRLPLWPAWSAALWIGEEALRGRIPFGGFPWGRLAFSQADGPFTAYAALGGAPLLGFTVALTGGLLAWTVPACRRPRTTPAALAALAAVAALAAGGLVLRAGLPTGGERQVTVAVIQGNVPRLGLDFNAQRKAVLANHVRRTVDLAREVRAGRQPRPDLVVWPENSSDIDPLADPDAAAQIDSAARAVDAPILVGAILNGPGDHARNAGILWSPTSGPGQTYVKRHPVPFGEYIPLRSLARRVSDKVDLVRRDLAAGDRVGVITARTRGGTVVLGDVICFEVAYDGLVRDTVTGGAGLLVVQTNNATFGRSGETSQQLAMGRIRSVEHGRTTLVAATSGISAVIGPDGSVRWDTEVFTDAAFAGPVPLREQRTLATRLGPWPERLLTAAGLAALAYLAAGAAATAGRTRRADRQEGKENA